MGILPNYAQRGAVSLDAHGTGFLWISFLFVFFLLPYSPSFVTSFILSA